MNTQSGFDLQYAKMLNRADTYSASENTFHRVSVQSDVDGIAVMRTDDAQKMHVMHTLVTQSGDSVIFKLDVLSYGRNSAQGADILSRVNRVIQTRESVWVSATRSNGIVQVDSVMVRKSSNGVITWTSATLTDYGMNEDSASKLVFKFIARLEANKRPVDQRDSATGLYADYVAQQALARASRHVAPTIA